VASCRHAAVCRWPKPRPNPNHPPAPHLRSSSSSGSSTSLNIILSNPMPLKQLLKQLICGWGGGGVSVAEGQAGGRGGGGRGTPGRGRRGPGCRARASRRPCPPRGLPSRLQDRPTQATAVSTHPVELCEEGQHRLAAQQVGVDHGHGGAHNQVGHGVGQLLWEGAGGGGGHEAPALGACSAAKPGTGAPGKAGGSPGPGRATASPRYSRRPSR
jgi:hypothetical protein